MDFLIADLVDFILSFFLGENALITPGTKAWATEGAFRRSDGIPRLSVGDGWDRTRRDSWLRPLVVMHNRRFRRILRGSDAFDATARARRRNRRNVSTL